MDILMKQAGAPAPKPSSVCAALPPSLDAPILHMMEKDPAARPDGIVKAIENLERAVASAGLSTSVALTPISALGDAAHVHTVIGKEMSETAAGTATVAVPSTSPGTSAAMESVTVPTSRSKTGLYAALGGAAVAALAIGGFALTRNGARKDPAETSTTQATAHPSDTAAPS